MLWLHTAYTGATPGILTTLPKPAKGMREKLVAWKKRSNIWQGSLFSKTVYLYFIKQLLTEKPIISLLKKYPWHLSASVFSFWSHKSWTLEHILAQLHFNKIYILVKAFPTEAVNVWCAQAEEAEPESFSSKADTPASRPAQKAQLLSFTTTFQMKYGVSYAYKEEWLQQKY